MDTATSTAEATKPQFETVALDEPIQRGETAIGSVDLRRPTTGELRGLSLRDIMDLDVGAMLVLLPRITAPTIHTLELTRMNPADFLALATEASGFFLPKAVRPASPTE